MLFKNLFKKVGAARVTSTLDTLPKLSNTKLGILQRKVLELGKAVQEERIDFDWAIGELQRIINGHDVGKYNRWNVWKVIEVGTGPTNGNEFFEVMKAEGFTFENLEDEMLVKKTLSRCKFPDSPKKVGLVRATSEELGFNYTNYTRLDLFNRAQSFGLNLCTPDVAAHLARQLAKEDTGTWLHLDIATKLVPHPKGGNLSPLNFHFNKERYDGIKRKTAFDLFPSGSRGTWVFQVPYLDATKD